MPRQRVPLCCSLILAFSASTSFVPPSAAARPELPPQRPQNPRSAVSEDLYQTRLSAAVSSILADGALVMAA